MYLSKKDQDIYKKYSDLHIENLKLKDQNFDLIVTLKNLEKQVKLLTLKLENPLIKWPQQQNTNLKK